MEFDAIIASLKSGAHRRRHFFGHGPTADPFPNQALANIRRHARATEVEIVLRRTPREIVLAVRDNGIGFEPRRIGAGHHGILGMRERAKLLGGQLRVGSRPGKGTSITARVPLQPDDSG